jgi:hypothetical protein
MLHKDKIVDALRTIAWFYWIAKRIGSDRPIDVRRAIEGEKAGIDEDGHPDMNNKFSLYKRGARCPGATMIAKAEAMVPGSSLIFTHPLWKALSHRGSIEALAVKLVKELHPDVQQWLLVSRGKSIQLTSLGLRELAKIATIDSLAALLIFFRLAHERDESRLRWECAEAICRILLVLGFAFGVLRIDEKIFDVFVHRFLYLAVHDGYARVWATYDYVSIAQGLHEWTRKRKSVAKKRYSMRYLSLQILRSLPKDEDLLPMVYPYLNFGPPTQQGSQLMQLFNNRRREARECFQKNEA